MTFYSIAGHDARTGKPYVYVETIGGGNGARYNKDGLDAVQVHMTNSSNLPIEALEMEYPLMVEEYALEEDSGGPGKYRGGLGIRRGIRIMPDSLDHLPGSRLHGAEPHEAPGALWAAWEAPPPTWTCAMRARRSTRKTR